MANQAIAKESTGLGWLWLSFFMFVLAAGIFFTLMRLPMADPYIQSVLGISGDSQRGEQIFLMNCSGCHGADAQGRVGPSLIQVSNRRSQLDLIHQITSGQTPPMPKFQAQPQEMADLLSYLNQL